jgi:hypothetical protein
VAQALARTLDYWRAQDAERGHHWDNVTDHEPFDLPAGGNGEWIPVYE